MLDEDKWYILLTRVTSGYILDLFGLLSVKVNTSVAVRSSRLDFDTTRLEPARV